MAAYTASYAQHQTSGIATVDSVLLSENGRYIEVVNRGATNILYFRLGATVAVTVDPVSTAADNFVVMPNTTLRVGYPFWLTGISVCVKVICAAAQPYSVQIIPDRKN